MQFRPQTVPDDSVSSSKLADGSVTTTKIAAAAITADKLANDVVSKVTMLDEPVAILSSCGINGTEETVSLASVVPSTAIAALIEIGASRGTSSSTPGKLQHPRRFHHRPEPPGRRRPVPRHLLTLAISLTRQAPSFLMPVPVHNHPGAGVEPEHHSLRDTFGRDEKEGNA